MKMPISLTNLGIRERIDCQEKKLQKLLYKAIVYLSRFKAESLISCYTHT
jgi:hypothetical protein